MPPRRDLQQGDDTARQLFGGGLFAPNFLQRAGSAITSATGRIGGVSERDLLPPSQFATPTAPQLGPLIRTSRFDQQAAPQPAQPAQPAFDYGTYAATRGLPTFDVTKTQTPFSQYSASAPQQLTAGLAQSLPQFPTQLPTRVSAPEAITPNQSGPAAGFARISDWSQNPLVQAARATGDISAIERATAQARSQGRGVFQPNDISAVSLASLRASNPEAGFGGSRTPAQQQALLAQMRANGARLAAQQTETMRTFAEGRGPRFAPAAAPQGRFGQALTGLFPQSTEAIAQRTERNAPFLAATGFGRMQQEQQRPIQFGIGRSPLYGGMGIGAAAGGPQPSRSMIANNTTKEQRRRLFSTI